MRNCAFLKRGMDYLKMLRKQEHEKRNFYNFSIPTVIPKQIAGLARHRSRNG
jgi:hypothetical protein